MPVGREDNVKLLGEESEDGAMGEADFFFIKKTTINSVINSVIIPSLFSEHFPYFKTAPAGWKNSVRHNLSLNKCFEKIEKPATNGTNQRKGCLWAMNPAKITKMDEEVQKWSRKDPMAIKKGMLLPRNAKTIE